MRYLCKECVFFCRNINNLVIIVLYFAFLIDGGGGWRVGGGVVASHPIHLFLLNPPLQVEQKRKRESGSKYFKTCHEACSYIHVLIRNSKIKTKVMYVKEAGLLFVSSWYERTAMKLTEWSVNCTLPIIMINVTAFCNCWLLQCVYNLSFKLQLYIFDRSYESVCFATLQALR